jgi:uncharacterized repeat protein (TIGR02543 family)
MTKKILILALLLGLASGLRAQIINAASCSQTDVQNALNAVVNTTTTVNIPPGTCHWTTQVSLTIPSGNSNLSIVGAGSGSTFIVDDYNSNSPILQITTNSTTTAKVRVTGISIAGGSGQNKYNGQLNVGGMSQNFRLDDNVFNMQTYTPIDNGNAAAIRYTGCVWGVTDHNTIYVHGTGNAIQIWEGNCFGDTGGQGDAAWSHAPDFGTAEFMYIENNVINSDFFNGFVTDCFQGGRYVARFNTANSAALQGHATGSGDGTSRSCRTMEGYNNTFNGTGTSTTNSSYNVNFIPGGSALMWGNNAAASGFAGYKLFLALVNDHFNGATNYDLCSGPPFGWGYNGTTAINNLFLPDVRRSDYAGVASPWDGNTNTEGYPVLDQAGYGTTDLLSGSYSLGCSTAGTRCAFADSSGGGSCTVHWPHQVSEPIYLVGNTWSAPSQSGGVDVGLTDATSNLIQENREYYRDTDNSGALLPFTGNTSTGPGTGSGLLSARPSSCTSGVLYRATDQGSWNTSGSGGQGVFYKCVGGAWTLFYTPYAYPHPLAGGGGPPQVTLTITSVGGLVTGNNCLSQPFNQGTIIGSCTATPNPGFVFAGWSGTGSAGGVSGTSPVTFTITSNSTLTATFNPIVGIPSALHGVYVPGGVIR